MPNTGQTLQEVDQTIVATLPVGFADRFTKQAALCFAEAIFDFAEAFICFTSSFISNA